MNLPPSRATESPLKLCRDCAHCVPRVIVLAGFPAPAFGPDYSNPRCNRWRNVVDGGPRYTCEEARESGGACGEDGSEFAEKPPKSQSVSCGEPSNKIPRIPPPSDWVSLALACAASLTFVVMCVAIYLAWPLL